MSNFETYYHFQQDFQKMDQHTGGKWLIHGTKRRKDNQLQSKHNIRIANKKPNSVLPGRQMVTKQAHAAFVLVFKCCTDSLYIDRLMQERRNSSALAMELRLSCTNPFIWYMNWFQLNGR